MQELLQDALAEVNLHRFRTAVETGSRTSLLKSAFVCFHRTPEALKLLRTFLQEIIFGNTKHEVLAANQESLR
jgi:hypothetical protein